MADNNTPHTEIKNPVLKWVDDRLPVVTMMNHATVDYPTPRNLNYWWNFGSLAGFCLILMIATGLVLAMHYTPHVDHAFVSVERIMRDEANAGEGPFAQELPNVVLVETILFTRPLATRHLRLRRHMIMRSGCRRDVNARWMEFSQHGRRLRLGVHV